MAENQALLREFIYTIVSEEIFSNELPDFLYHVTYFNRLESVAKQGLKPGNARSIGGAVYDFHRNGKLFLTSDSGIFYWFNKAEEFAEYSSDHVYDEGFVPIVIRVNVSNLDSALIGTDEIGSRDALSSAFTFSGTIPPSAMEIWDGNNWISIGDYWDIDTLQSFDVEADPDSGEDLYWFKSSNPLLPRI